MKKTFKNFMAIAILAMTFAACEDVPEPYYVFAEDNTPTTVSESTGSGTVDDPFNVAAAIAKCKEIGTDPSAESYYVKGIVVSGGSADAQYGNASFYIADSQDGGDMFYCFQVLGSGGAKLPAGYAINIGDEVVIYGPIYNYKGNTPETAGKGAAYIVTINGKATSDANSGNDEPVGEAKGDGTLANPYNSVAAINLAKSLSSGNSDNVYIKGKVVSVKEQYGTQYGNATFYISDDGTETDQFYVFHALYLGNKKYTSGSTLNKGDDVIIYGKVTNYQGNTPETVQNESYLYSLNGKTEGGNDNPNPQPTNESSMDNPFTVAKALEVARALSSSETVANVYVKGVVVEFVSFDANYHNSRYYIADATDATDRLYIFDGKGLDNADLNAAEDIKVGDEVIVYGTLSNYLGTTPEMNRGNYLVFHNGNSGGGGNNDNPNPQPGNNPGEVNGNTIMAAMSAFGLDNEADLTTLTLSDGTTLTFAQNDGKNMPKYYAVDSTARLYALSSLEVKAKKNIQKVVLNCISGRTGNETLTATATSGSVNISKTDTSLTFYGFSASTLTIVNDHTGNSGGTQVRIVGIEITYAE